MSSKVGTTLAAMAVLAAGGLSASADGALIGMDLDSYPDIASGFMDVVYDASSDSFLADGFALEYTRGPVDTENITSGDFLLTATIDEFGNASSGSLSVGGDLIGISGPLLEGSLVDFGFLDGGGSAFEFIFQVTGGQLAGDYGGVGEYVGVVMNMVNGSYSDFNSNFSNRLVGIPGTGNGVSNIKPATLPAPGALALLLGGVITTRRRRRDG